MRVTVAIATYNRADEVERTLVTLARLDTDGCPDHEVLVVDNNSTDDTPDVVARFAPLFAGRLKYTRETRQGLSHARNTAMREAKYEIVAFLDDDVDVSSEWLRRLSAVFAEEDVATVGGRAFLVYPSERPKWLSEEIEGLLTKVELGEERRPARPDEVYGVNLSFRADWLRRAGEFRTDVGRVGNLLLGGEDSDMLERVAALGGRIVYEPGAVVGHRVPRTRLTRAWFWRRCFWGHMAGPRLWADRQLTALAFVRAVWRVGRIGWRCCVASLFHGPRSAVCFSQVLRVASELGCATGIFGELCRRLWRKVGSERSTEASPAAVKV